MNKPTQEPWEPTDATNALRGMGRSPALSVAYKLHATERLAERGLIVSELLHLLKHGYVYLLGRVSTKSHGYFKYEIEGVTPNSGGRGLRAVVIPNRNTCATKVVTIMWVDESQTKAGTILETEK